eukprot:CAMPEP_0203670684 /NCGR_PEP_ID=MMETSP0090-20130426/6683_1 /ASSEMBLY_ACC=CAM_ASM_001088 /TAXON_ID=426623 /ORGANISM="Chaetoceros affinis, Strain CCMP159" /LENGTH=1567 /DNA_ID=CAMNT_0050535593 /DNA_START=14 /DNA_END=4717 /DNA_ORIENTATION=+
MTMQKTPSPRRSVVFEEEDDGGLEDWLPSIENANRDSLIAANMDEGRPFDQLLRRSSIKHLNASLVDAGGINNVSTDKKNDSFFDECNTVFKMLRNSWGVNNVRIFSLEMDTQLSRSPLESIQDAIIVTEGWNKSLAFRSMFSEAIVGRWRMLAAMTNLDDDNQKSKLPNSERRQSITAFIRSSMLGTDSEKNGSLNNIRTSHTVEVSNDPIARCLGLRIRNLEALVIGLIDVAVRELCPHNQVVQREAYRALQGSNDPDESISNPFIHENECKTLDDYANLFAKYGLRPKFWLDFCNAFVWAMKTHNPYAHQEQYSDDFEKPAHKGAFTRFVAGMIALPMVEATFRYENYIQQRIFLKLEKIYSGITDGNNNFVSGAFKNAINSLFKERPEMVDHFGENDMDSLHTEFLILMENLVKNFSNVNNHHSEIRKMLIEQGELWLEKQIPFDFVALLGNAFLDAAKPYLHSKAGAALGQNLEMALAYIYKEAMHFILTPLVINRNLHTASSKFYKEVALELSWSDQALHKRMVEVHAEILSTGTYTQTSEEIEVGARLAWRNSSKCIGRIAWNTLKVRDCRHVFSPDMIFTEICEHIKLASGGTNIESVMTVFRPQHPNEMWGMRFWSHQFFRYAGYKNKNTGKVLGDPANADFTEYLINSSLWSPPLIRSGFDLLPLILKMPGIAKPFVYNIPKTLTHELDIEHPQFPAVKGLGLKWGAIPAITNFKMNLGGLNYPCIPFNGWFVSTEIARNLLERYQMTIPLAKAMNIPSNDRMLAQKVSAELENAILHSFEKHEYTIVDPMTVGKQFITHCKRERESGRECPAQWSWIGGLVGPTNPTWHHEMRDFKKDPQYEYCSNPWQVINIEKSYNTGLLDTTQHHQLRRSLLNHGSKPDTKENLPKVLIAFGSETGNAEAIARSLARKVKLCQPKVMSLNSVTKRVKSISREFTHFLAVCSTFGNGEPPSNAKMFFSNYDLGSIDTVSCVVLALGSSLYPMFCKAGKNLQKMITESGGHDLLKFTCIDNAKDNNQDLIMKWLERTSKLVLPDSLLSDLSAMALANKEINAESTFEIKWREDEIEKQEEIPTVFKPVAFPAGSTMMCLKNYELFTHNDVKFRSTRHIEFALPEGDRYETGDHVSVSPLNDPLMVQRFLKCFKFELEKASEGGVSHKTQSQNDNLLPPSVIRQVQKVFHIEVTENGETVPSEIPHLTDLTLWEVLQANVDLSLNQESYAIDLLGMMMKRLEKLPSTSQQSESFKAFYTNNRKNAAETYPTIVQLLEEYGSVFCEPFSGSAMPLVSLADILVLMPRLSPRYYSISSSMKSSHSSFSLTVGVINFQAKNGEKIQGVCSKYLANLKPGDKAKVAIKSSAFRPPTGKAAPIVMVCTGTGIAPMMGFLRERSKGWYNGSNKNVGECHLFFGCRVRDEVLYREELFLLQSSNMIQLHLAFSRDEDFPKQYVSDKMKLKSKMLNQLLQGENTHVYICGDAQIANNCTETCIEILTSSGMSRIAAIQYVNQMLISDRLQYDVYGTADLYDVLKEKDHDIGMTNKARRIWTDRFLNSGSISNFN